MGGPCSKSQIIAWLNDYYPGENTSDVEANAYMLAVNAPSRATYDQALLNLRSDADNPKNLLFKRGEGKGNVRFEPYDPLSHGIWVVERNSATRKLEARQLPASGLELATAQARQAQAQLQPLEDMPDERTRALRLVVLREGRKEFRNGLVQAYGGRCAVSGCAVLEILEAAHIHPYSGLTSDRSDNGLLLRADIHTLFDKGLVWIEHARIVRVSPRLQGSEYQTFDGRRLLDTGHEQDRPHPGHLRNHRLWALSRPV